MSHLQGAHPLAARELCSVPEMKQYFLFSIYAHVAASNPVIQAGSSTKGVRVPACACSATATASSEAAGCLPVTRRVPGFTGLFSGNKNPAPQADENPV